MKKNLKNKVAVTAAAALMAMTALTGCSALGEAPTVASEENTQAETGTEKAEAESDAAA